VSNLSDLMPAGASGKTIEAVATATIASKKPVILNSAGTVTEVVESSDSAGSPTVFESDTSLFIATTFDSSNNKVVVAYRDNGNSFYGTAAVGTVSGDTISYGTPVVFESGATEWCAATFDSSNNKVVIAYRDEDNSNYGTGVVGTVSGTSISFGTPVVFSSSSTMRIAATFDTNNNAVAIAYVDFGNSEYGTAVVGTVSGTAISFGTPVVYESAATSWTAATFDTSYNRNVIAYMDDANSDYGTVQLGVISGTSFIFGGSPIVFATAATTHIAATYDSNLEKVVIAYRDDGNSMYGTAIVGTVTGSYTMTFGTEVVFEADRSDYISAAFDSSNNKAVIGYQDPNNSDYGTAIVGTVSGTTISFGTAVVFEAAGTQNIAVTFDSNENKAVIAYTDVGNSNYGTGLVFSVGGTNLTATNFVGIADAGISTSATGTIVVQGGTIAGMSGLTTGGKYYVQDDGTLTSPNATEAYSINGATYDSVSFDVTQDSTITGMCFNDDGTKMYVCGESSDKVYQYTLSSAYDLSTASYDSVSLDVSSQQGAPRSVVFNNDGSALYIVGTSAAAVHQYTLSTEYDLSTGSYASKTVSVSTQELYPCGVIFNNDGASMYVVGSQNETVYQYTLSTPFDVSTASYASKSLDGSSEQGSSTGLAFNSDGTKIFIIGETPTKIFQYTLSSAYDMSTGSYDSVSYTYSEGTVPRDIVWGNSGNKFYIPDSGPDDIYQYTAGGGASSSVNAGLALSATQLLLNGDS
jgi:sugar lactone lactonase YvrE